MLPLLLLKTAQGHPVVCAQSAESLKVSPVLQLPNLVCAGFVVGGAQKWRDLQWTHGAMR